MGAPGLRCFLKKIVIGVRMISPNWLGGGEEGAGPGPAWRRRQRPRGGWSPRLLQNEEGGPSGRCGRQTRGPGLSSQAARPPRGHPPSTSSAGPGRQVWRWAGSPEPPHLPGLLLLPPPACAGHSGLAARGARCLRPGRQGSLGVTPSRVRSPPPHRGPLPGALSGPAGRGALPGGAGAMRPRAR